MFTIKRKQPGRIRRHGGTSSSTAWMLARAIVTSEERRQRMAQQAEHDAAQQAQSADDPNLVEYTHTAKIARHLEPVGCAGFFLIWVEDRASRQFGAMGNLSRESICRIARSLADQGPTAEMRHYPKPAHGQG
jgi:hypothetical protein